MRKRIIIFTGGIGNQMFQYALLLALRKRGFHVQADISYYDFFQMHNGFELERVFGIKEQLINKQKEHITWLRLLNRFRPSFLYKFDGYEFDNWVLTKPHPYIFGYWQDERYFLEIAEDVRRTYDFKDIDKQNKLLSNEMSSLNSVSLHIRRGDYAEFGMNIIGEDYYEKAVSIIKNKVNNPIFYIFSDDIAVAENMAKGMGLNYQIVKHNRGKDSYKDMYLMSQCKHNIIANSSFSWWGAWLNNYNGKIVLAPKFWSKKRPSFAPQCVDWILL